MLLFLMPDSSGFLSLSWSTYSGLLAHSAMALSCCAMAALLYIHRFQASEEVRSLLLWLAAFLTSLGVEQGLHSLDLDAINGSMTGGWHILTALLGLVTAWQMRSKLPRFVVIPTDTEDLREQLEQDPLTGVANYVGLERAFERLVSHYGGNTLRHSLMLLNLRGLDQVNQTYTRQGGDALLLTVAQVLCDRSRSLDTVARIGEDEFALLLKGCPLDEAVHIAESLCEEIAQVVPPGFSPHHLPLVSTSVGITEVFPGLTYETCYGQAALALQQSRQKGQNQVSSMTMLAQASLQPATSSNAW